MKLFLSSRRNCGSQAKALGIRNRNRTVASSLYLIYSLLLRGTNKYTSSGESVNSFILIVFYLLFTLFLFIPFASIFHCLFIFVIMIQVTLLSRQNRYGDRM